MRIIIEKKNDYLNFYLTDKKYLPERLFLFSQKFSKGVYEYFKNGRDENELRAFNKWRKNPRLDKTIEKIPMYVKYALKEAGLI